MIQTLDDKFLVIEPWQILIIQHSKTTPVHWSTMTTWHLVSVILNSYYLKLLNSCTSKNHMPNNRYRNCSHSCITSWPQIFHVPNTYLLFQVKARCNTYWHHKQQYTLLLNTQIKYPNKINYQTRRDSSRYHHADFLQSTQSNPKQPLLKAFGPTIWKHTCRNLNSHSVCILPNHWNKHQNYKIKL